ncbi:MAG: hypothetical protein F6Q13_10170 [Mycobacterium sp.]|nr:MAG: hypothetical protein F6Q13_10170 [Mycobacterium sp.]
MYVMANAAAAQSSGGSYLLFPGLAALAHDTLTRPWGKWASQPGRLVVTPVLGAAIGTVITREFRYGVLALLFSVSACVLLIAVLRSNIGPAIAAGTLPLVLGIQSWLYPVSIALGLVALVGIVVPWKKRYRRKYEDTSAVSVSDLDDHLEAPPTGVRGIAPFFLFVTVMASSAMLSGFRLILVPPLIVMGYEMFAHPASCAWTGKPLSLPVACLLTSTGGWLAVSQFGKGAIAAGCAMVVGIVVLRALKLHLPPALSIGLLPLVIDSPDIGYPISVSIGAAALTVAFLLYRRWIIGRCRAGERR